MKNLIALLLILWIIPVNALDIHVATNGSDADTAVSYAENTALVAEKIKKAGGSIKLIRKNGMG